MRRQIVTCVLTALSVLWPLAAYSFDFYILTPPGVEVASPYGEVRSQADLTMHRILVSDTLSGVPIPVELRGPFGGIVRKSYVALQGDVISVGTAIVTDSHSNPERLEALPALCPRVWVDRESLVYDAHKDILNTIPIIQLLDPDAKPLPRAERTLERFDCKNVLMMISFDYEDSGQVKARGLDGVAIPEEQSGFYANFHIAVLPYSESLLAHDPSELLRIAEGKASLRGISLDPLWAWRTHSFLPGPFLSRSDFFYDMCEWGDTAYQAPAQRVRYDNLAIWDWDYPVGDQVVIVIWEGDEEEPLVSRGLVAPGDIIDDLIAVFIVARDATREPKTLESKARNVGMHIQTGDMRTCR
jgi:hypothetical protein